MKLAIILSLAPSVIASLKDGAKRPTARGCASYLRGRLSSGYRVWDSGTTVTVKHGEIIIATLTEECT